MQTQSLFANFALHISKKPVFIVRFGLLFDAFGKMDAPLTAVIGNGPDSIDNAAKVGGPLFLPSHPYTFVCVFLY